MRLSVTFQPLVNVEYHNSNWHINGFGDGHLEDASPEEKKTFARRLEELGEEISDAITTHLRGKYNSDYARNEVMFDINVEYPVTYSAKDVKDA